MSRHLNSHPINKHGPTHNFQQILRLRTLNQDRRSVLASINNDKGLQEIRKNNNSYQNPLLSLDFSKKFVETARASIKEVHNIHAQLNNFTDNQFCFERKKITPKNYHGFESTRENKRSLSQNNNLNNHLQYAKNMRIEFQKARKYLNSQDFSAKSKLIVHDTNNQTDDSQSFHSQNYKPKQQITHRLQPLRVRTEVDENKARYSDIPMVEFLYQNGGRCKTLSRSLERKLQTMRRGQIQSKTGLRG